MTTKLLLPFINQNVTTFRGPTWYLSDKVSIEAIATEDYGLIFRDAPDEYKSLLSPKSKCIRVNAVDKDQCIEIAKVEGIKIAFLLNYFKGIEPVAIAFAIQITKKNKSRLDQLIDLPVVSDARLKRDNNYRIRSGVPREYISKLYQIISEVYMKHPGILLTLDRFNSALFRTELYDKIIDITISLESLIKGTTEIYYKFALYNAWAAEDQKENRRDSFELLKSLYDARSKIVHGTKITEKAGKSIKTVLAQWEDIIKITEKIIGYHLLYLSENDIDKWHEHQENLALGVEGRNVW